MQRRGEDEQESRDSVLVGKKQKNTHYPSDWVGWLCLSSFRWGTLPAADGKGLWVKNCSFFATLGSLAGALSRFPFYSSGLLGPIDDFTFFSIPLRVSSYPVHSLLDHLFLWLSVHNIIFINLATCKYSIKYTHNV